jgi:hypothetical protein
MPAGIAPCYIVRHNSVLAEARRVSLVFFNGAKELFQNAKTARTIKNDEK